MSIVDRYQSPEIAGAFRQFQLAELNVYKMLVDGKLTYGKAWEVRYGLIGRWQQTVGRYERARQFSNAAAGGAAAAQLSAAARAWSIFNQHPTVTNCSLFGASASCVSQ